MTAFLKLYERNILMHAGKVSVLMARQHADQEFAKHEASLRRRSLKTIAVFDEIMQSFLPGLIADMSPRR